MGVPLEEKESPMTQLIILGSANAVPDPEHENTHMAVVGEQGTLLIDCVSNPVVRLSTAGIELDNITDIILTHFHPDHVSGTPLLLMNLWLLGRKKPLIIHGLTDTLTKLEKLLDFYEWSKWPNFFPVTFHPLPDEEMTPVLDSEEFKVFASPVKHLIPTIGLRIEFPFSGKSMAYSCDTEPCDQVVKLASGVDVLLHEATGKTPGHSSAWQAGQVARNAEAGCLYLIHYPTRGKDPQQLVEEARREYQGEIALAEDFLTIDF
jgi:ribonuclease Z